MKPTSLTTRVRIDNVSFDALTMESAVARIIAMARASDRPRYVCTGNLDHLVRLDRDEAFREVYACADLVLADGMAVVWLSRLLGDAVLPERVAGSDLFWELARASSGQGLRLFFLGGAPEAAERAACVVEERFPGVCIAGTYCPPVDRFDTEEEQVHIWELVTEARPDILLVGLGAPKQETWIAANLERLGVPVAIGVGGTFEMAAGIRQRAPLWIQKAGLEWFFRFTQEPLRLFRRYFIDDLPYFVRAVVGSHVLRARPSRG